MESKNWLATVVGVLFIGPAIWLVLATLGNATERNALRNAEHKKECRDARIAFFSECLRTTTRPECEVMWAEKRGRVFDADPDKPWAREVDCSDQTH